jgi:cell division protein FtsI (penicillin-binding protein 3)
VERDRMKLVQLAKLLQMPLADLMAKLDDEDKTFVWLKRQVDEPVAKQVAELGIKGIYQRKEYKREYPEGESAVHVVGFTNVEDNGQEGVELTFNKELAGRSGSRRVIKDRLGRVVEDVGDQIPPLEGKDLQLSIDSKVQFFAYQKLRESVLEHKAKAGSVVVLDAVTGEVLALANYPSYNPDKRRNLSGEQLRNRALTDTFEPGSVMKPFTIGLALETKRVTPQTIIDTTPGRITITGSTISDSHPNGVLTVEGVLQKSSNVGTTKIAMQMESREMWDLFTQAGFGQKPQIAFPGAVSGRLRPYKTWRPIEQATMSYGYGLSASLFQMVRSYTVFSHDGQLIPVTLTKNSEPAVGVQVLSPRTASQIRKMLQMAAGPGGTGQKAQTMGYSVGGKSGTAYKLIGKNYGSDKNRKYRGWFVGMAPIDNPRIVVGVMIDEPSAGKHYGGDVAAPVFSETVQQTLRIMGVQPDMAVRPQIVADAVEESF